MALSYELVENKYNNRKVSVTNAFIDQLYSIGINKIFNKTYKNPLLKQKQIFKEFNNTAVIENNKNYNSYNNNKNNNNSNDNDELKLPRIYNNFIVSNSDNILKKLQANDPEIDFYENR